jgi:hypothetical protein
MTGLYSGYAIVGVLVILLTLYMPLITIILLSKTGLFNSKEKAFKILKYLIVYFVLAVLTLAILKYGQEAVKWLLLYTIIVTVITIVKRFLNKRTR